MHGTNFLAPATDPGFRKATQLRGGQCVSSNLRALRAPPPPARTASHRASWVPALLPSLPQPLPTLPAPFPGAPVPHTRAG